MKSTTLEKMPPYDESAEKAVLGSLMIDSERMNDIRYIVKSGDFFIEQNKMIFEACLEIYNNADAIDEITVARNLTGKNQLEEIGGVAYLGHLVSEVPTSLHIQYYAKIVKQTSLQRQAITMGHKIMQMGYEEPDTEKLISGIEQNVLDIQKEIAMPKLIIPKDLAKMGADYYSELQQGKRQGIYTGFYELDKLTGGIFGSEYVVFAGRPGDGKTESMLSMAEYAGKYFGPVLIASLEQHWREILDRFQSRDIGISPRKIRAGNYSDETMSKILQVLARLSDSNMYFYDTGGSIEASSVSIIQSIANHMKLSFGLRAVFVDYLQLIKESEKPMDARERTTLVSMKLKNMARMLDVPVIVLCQMNRDVEKRAGHLPVLSDLRESGAIEQDADGVLFIHRPDRYEEEDDENPEKMTDKRPRIIIRKWRQDGSISNHQVFLKYDITKRQYFGYDNRNIMEVPEEFR